MKQPSLAGGPRFSHACAQAFPPTRQLSWQNCNLFGVGHNEKVARLVIEAYYNLTCVSSEDKQISDQQTFNSIKRSGGACALLLDMEHESEFWLIVLIAAKTDSSSALGLELGLGRPEGLSQIKHLWGYFRPGCDTGNDAGMQPQHLDSREQLIPFAIGVEKQDLTIHTVREGFVAQLQDVQLAFCWKEGLDLVLGQRRVDALQKRSQNDMFESLMRHSCMNVLDVTSISAQKST